MNWKSLSRTFFWIGPISVLLVALWSPVPILAQDSSPAPSTQRKTSNPYTGDLSIFETPGRDERLQINRVMDLLGIGPGKNVADIGAGSGWFTVRAARRVTAPARFTPWTSTRKQFATSTSAQKKSNSRI
jgi:hypothetical protein